MKKLDIKAMIGGIAKRFRVFLDRTILVILVIILIFIGFVVVVGYKYIFHPIAGEFPYKNNLIEIDAESYFVVNKIWIEKEERLKAAKEGKFTNPFSPIVQNPSVIPTPPFSNELINDRISVDELENLLARTLFEFYQMRGEEMPMIPERAVIWEELGLGTAQEYRGIYSQNVLLLRTLKEVIKNEQPQ